MRAFHSWLGLFLLLFAFGALAPPASAQAPTTPASALDWTRELDAVRDELRKPGTDAQPQVLRGRLEAVYAQAEAARQAARGSIAEQERLLGTLGPAPAEGAPAEAAEVAQQRRTLNRDLAAAQGRLKQAELAITRTQALLDETAALERRQVAVQIFHRGPTPFALGLWTDAAQQLVATVGAVAAAPAEWWQSETRQRRGGEAALQLLIAVVLIGGVGVPLRAWILRRFGRDRAVVEPAYARRLVAAVAEGIARTLMPVAAVVAIALLLRANGMLVGMFGAGIEALARGLVYALLIAGVAQAALAPERPSWRIAEIGADAARLLGRRLFALATLVGIETLVAGVSDIAVTVGAALDAAFRIVAVVAFAAIILLLSDATLWRRPPRPDETPSTGPAVDGWRKLRIAVRAIVAVALLALPFGFYSLAVYLIESLLLSAALVGLYATLHLAVADGLQLMASGTGPRTVRLRRLLALEGAAGETFRFWVGAAINAVLWLGLALVLLLVWGVPASTLAGWAGQAFGGIQVGSVTISLFDLVAAALVFAAGVLVTRLVQRGLENRLLPQAHVDPGIRHSIVAGTGYAGFVLAALFAISALGLNLSNLALIAGALSVGIGFGLQNIVNNFVSGLILLIERPVKVGDWVVVGENEGYVRRISVRATEIETFPRASVIIPNSELLSSAVMNWTHRNRVGRIDIVVGAAYGSPPEKVRDLLLECARRHPAVNQQPAPYVLFREFGDSALTFVLRGFISDVESRVFIESDLRYAIYKAFAEHGIEIPFKQTDIHIRNLDDLQKILAERRPAAQDSSKVATKGA